LPPSCSVAATSIVMMSSLDMPSLTLACTCRIALIVTSLAACMSASSAGDLCMRQALTRASPETTVRGVPEAFVTLSTMK
jgi:hypothetical protein